MNRIMLYTVSLLVIGATSLPVLAQDGGGKPPQGGGDRVDRPGGGGPGGPGGGPGFGPGGMGGGPGMGGMAGMGGPGMGGGHRGPRGGGDDAMVGPPSMAKFEMLRGYIEVVDRFARMSLDPSTAGVAAVISANDLLRQRGTDAAIEHFTKILPEVKNEAVQRAIRIQLADLYKQAGQADKAMEQLDELMKSAPAAASGGAMTPAP